MLPSKFFTNNYPIRTMNMIVVYTIYSFIVLRGKRTVQNTNLKNCKREKIQFVFLQSLLLHQPVRKNQCHSE